ncbi:MAG TPA: hypothetical protein PKL17_15375 [Pseudomonadota bacterium]|jgi:hypothetical protein|nr:hypothetical protein [Pseudomonadota bacterium]HNN52766.1 hypothetical protein [Pseudomonadota bacterium]
MKRKSGFFVRLGLVSMLGLIGCQNAASTPDPTMDPTQPTDVTQPPVSPNTSTKSFDHDDILGNIGNPFADGRQVLPSDGQRMHVCGKIMYQALGTILTTRGINIANPAADSAGVLYQGGANIMGVANYPARVAEADRNSTGGLTRMFDMMLAVAEELIPTATTDRIGTGTACPGATLFNADNTCNADGFACLLGSPLTTVQLTECSNGVKRIASLTSNDIMRAKRMTVATIASSAYLCD